ncbi:hypothetical protein ACMGDK_11355 [Chryseobacterium sp. DT-3]|uniref:hypothetical protein n=1 Tax=Chryseobacterium sp. DT-3 TaxID=3396164 RepID=UPI003F1A73E8
MGTEATDIKIRIDDENGTTVNYRKNSKWYDDSAINDDRLDGKIFGKIDGEYYKKTISKEAFLKVGTIDELRSTNGYYEGQEISLLGYYGSGDKLPVTYKFTVQNFDSLLDDGGKFIKTSRGTWVAQFDGRANIKDFGAVEDQTIDTIVSKILTIPEIHTIELDKGAYKIPTSSSITIPANKHLSLHPETTITKVANTGFVPFIIINGDNAKVSNGYFVTTGNSLHEGSVVVKNGTNVTIDGSSFENSTIGIRIMPEVGEKVSNIDILNTKFNNCKYHIDLGKGVDGSVGEIEDVIIFGMKSKNGKDIAEGGDGIKTRQKVKGLKIVLCTIDGPSRDCVDLFASGELVTIAECTFKNAKVKGIDIKREPAYDESIYGKNGEMIRIINTDFIDMPIGVSISGNYEPGNYKANKFIRVEGNTFLRIKTRAVIAMGKYLRIYGNDFISCSYNDTVNYPSIEIGQDTGVSNTITTNVFVKENTFVNCCSAVAPSLNTEPVIRISDYCKSTHLEKNIIDNDPEKERPNMYTGIYVNSSSEAILRNNTINVLGKPLHAVSGSSIIGTKISFPLGTKPAILNRAVKLYRFDRKAQLISADYSIGVATTADATNYSAADLQVNGLTAASFNTITAVDTNINRKTISSNYMAQQGQDLQVRFNNGGTGVQLENLVISLNYIDC